MPKFCANLTMLYGEHPFLDRFAAARTDGFDAVEFMFPYQFPKEQVADALQRNGLRLVLHNLPAGDWEAGERGVASHPGREGEFRDGVGRAIEYAQALDCPQVNCLVGIPPQGADPEQVRRAVVENLRFAADALKQAGIRLLIEPVNNFDIPGFWLRSTDQAVGVMDEVSTDNLFLQYDLYHQQRTDGELLATWRRLRDRIAHVQVADNPGRGEPGTGEINYPFLFESLDREGYTGWIGCEYKPCGGTSAGLGWLKPYRRAEATGYTGAETTNYAGAVVQTG
jgi:hydroxypyruvate isomerase